MDLQAAGILRKQRFDRLASAHYSSEYIMECFVFFLNPCTINFNNFVQIFLYLFYILSIISIKNEKLSNSYFRFLWDTDVLRLVVYLLNMICLNLRFLYNILYLCVYRFSYKFGTVLYQFLQTGTSDRTLMGLDLLLKCLGFSLYPL